MHMPYAHANAHAICNTQVLTGESWSEAVARPIVFADYSEPGAALSPVFFVTFILLCGIVLINVAVAVLLEKMVEPEQPHDLADGASSEASPNGFRSRSPSPGSRTLEEAHAQASESASSALRDDVAQLRRDLDAMRAEATEREVCPHPHPPNPPAKPSPNLPPNLPPLPRTPTTSRRPRAPVIRRCAWRLSWNGSRQSSPACRPLCAAGHSTANGRSGRPPPTQWAGPVAPPQPHRSARRPNRIPTSPDEPFYLPADFYPPADSLLDASRRIEGAAD